MYPRLMTIKQAAANLSVSPEFLKKLQRNGRIRVVHLGRAVRLAEEEIQRLCRAGLTR